MFRAMFFLSTNTILHDFLCITGQVNVAPLDPDESFHVAMVALQNNKFQYALLWLQETFRQLEDGIPALVTRREVLTYLGPLAFQMGNLPLALELLQQLQELGMWPLLHKGAFVSLMQWFQKQYSDHSSPESKPKFL